MFGLSLVHSPCKHHSRLTGRMPVAQTGTQLLSFQSTEARTHKAESQQFYPTEHWLIFSIPEFSEL
jgi:hypothetical protein